LLVNADIRCEGPAACDAAGQLLADIPNLPIYDAGERQNG
jgi:hypothetical protein